MSQLVEIELPDELPAALQFLSQELACALFSRLLPFHPPSYRPILPPTGSRSRTAWTSLALWRALTVIGFLRMAYLTMEVEIDHGRIIPKEPEKLPARGKALLTVLEATERQPDWDKVMGLLGTMQNRVDGLEYQQEVRAEWDDRELGERSKP